MKGSIHWGRQWESSAQTLLLALHFLQPSPKWMFRVCAPYSNFYPSCSFYRTLDTYFEVIRHCWICMIIECWTMSRAAYLITSDASRTESHDKTYAEESSVLATVGVCDFISERPCRSHSLVGGFRSGSKDIRTECNLLLRHTSGEP